MVAGEPEKNRRGRVVLDDQGGRSPQRDHSDVLRSGRWGAGEEAWSPMCVRAVAGEVRIRCCIVN